MTMTAAIGRTIHAAPANAARAEIASLLPAAMVPATTPIVDANWLLLLSAVRAMPPRSVTFLPI